MAKYILELSLKKTKVEFEADTNLQAIQKSDEIAKSNVLRRLKKIREVRAEIIPFRILSRISFG